MANAWLAHVKKTMRAHKGMKFSQVLKMAKSSYKKGGASPVSDSESSKAAPAKDDVPASDVATLPAGTGGRRRRRGSSRRTRRHRRR